MERKISDKCRLFRNLLTLAPGMDAWSGVGGSQAKEKTQKNISVPA